jgi:hypothetical protein
VGPIPPRIAAPIVASPRETLNEPIVADMMLPL